MPTIRQYRPAYFTGFEEEVVDFNTIDELLNIGFVKNFSDKSSPSNKAFFRFSMSDAFLMAEYERGTKWWGVGHITNDPNNICSALPKWEPQESDEEKEKKAQQKKDEAEAAAKAAALKAKEEAKETELVSILLRAKHVVLLTGAGASKESGIATFRDGNGLWNKHNVEDVA